VFPAFLQGFLSGAMSRFVSVIDSRGGDDNCDINSTIYYTYEIMDGEWEDLGPLVAGQPVRSRPPPLPALSLSPLPTHTFSWGFSFFSIFPTISRSVLV
jgi:hypothetical protein